MKNNHEKQLKQNLLTESQLRQAGFPRKDFEQIEEETHREEHAYDFYICNCGAEYGEHEKDKLTQCHYCGKTICPDCKKDHVKNKFNRERYGVCSNKKEKINIHEIEENLKKELSDNLPEGIKFVPFIVTVEKNNKTEIHLMLSGQGRMESDVWYLKNKDKILSIITKITGYSWKLNEQENFTLLF